MSEIERKKGWWRTHVGNSAEHKGFFGLMFGCWVVVLIIGSQGSPLSNEILVSMAIVFWGGIVVLTVYLVSFVWFWHREIINRVRFMFGTPGVMLMSPEDMYIHVATFVETAKVMPDQAKVTQDVLADLALSLMVRAEVPDWLTLKNALGHRQCLDIAKTIGQHADKHAQNGDETLSMGEQLFSISMRARTMNDPIAVMSEEILDGIIAHAAQGSST